MRRSQISLKSKPFIIVFDGLVGAGKSTQIKVLSVLLEKKYGLKVGKSWIKTNHLLAYILTKILLKILRENGLEMRYLLLRGRRIFARIYSLWLLLDAISITIKVIIDIFIKSLFKDVILVEEYIPSIISDYYYFNKKLGINYLPRTFNIIISYLLGLLTKRDSLIVYLYSPTSELRLRWLKRGTPPEIVEYLQVQSKTLRRIIEALPGDKLVINTSRYSISETSRIIINTVIKYPG